MHANRIIPCSWSIWLVLGACDPADLEPCSTEDDPRASGKTIPDRYKVDITWSAGDIESRPVTGPVRVTGQVDANIRLDRLLVGDQPVTASRSNYADWSVELAVATLQGFREGEFAELPVEAYDVCDRPYMADPVRARIDAPSGAGAEGLAMTSTPVQLIEEGVPECYVPADGSGLVIVELTAAPAAAGVEVTLASTAAGTFLGASASKVSLRLDQDGATAVGPAVFFQASAAGRLGLSASAGPTFAIDSTAELAAVAAPSFAGAAGAIPPSLPVLVRARTAGRLARCHAISSRPDMISVVASDDTNLLVNDLVLGDDPTCDQSEELTVTFAQGTPTGTTVDITCEDTYGQASTRTLSAE